MLEAFLLQYDINGSAAVAGFEDEEIYDFLTKAQLELVKNVYYTKGPEPLQTLIDNQNGILTNITSSGWGNPYTYVLAGTDFPDDFLFYINSRVKVTRSNYPSISSPTWVDTMPTKYDDISNFVPGSDNVKIFYHPLSYINDDNLSIIVDSYTTVIESGTDPNVIMGYLKVPRDINQLILNPDVHEKFHNDIVELAVFNAIKVTNDVRARTRTPQKQ